MKANLACPIVCTLATAAGGAADVPPRPPLSASESLQRALYGAPREATLEEILESPADFEGRAVAVRGRLTPGPERGEFLLGSGQTSLRAEPLPAVAARVRAQAPGFTGREVEIVGVLLRDRRVPEQEAGRRLRLRFWKYHAPTRPPAVSEGVPRVSLEAIVAGGGAADGNVVRTVGQFRGSNLRGDLPPGSRLDPTDWVIKDDRYAVWVTGHGPDGDGFRLDPLTFEDQENWIEVVGKPESRDGIAYLKAQRVFLTEPPAGAAAPHSSARGPLTALPPALMFTLPVDGEDSAPPDVRLVLQFNTCMDERSFAGRVRLRAADGTETLPEVRLAYDEDKHALVVEPARPLPPGRELVLELLDGIVDVHGLALAKGRLATDGAFEALRFRVDG